MVVLGFSSTTQYSYGLTPMCNTFNSNQEIKNLCTYDFLVTLQVATLYETSNVLRQKAFDLRSSEQTKLFPSTLIIMFEYVVS